MLYLTYAIRKVVLKMVKSKINVRLLESKMALSGFRSRKEFAEAIGTTSHTVSNLLNGVHKPSHELMDVIFQVLKLTPEEGMNIFFGGYLRDTKVKSKEGAK